MLGVVVLFGISLGLEKPISHFSQESVAVPEKSIH
jgi:hypothetical protein